MLVIEYMFTVMYLVICLVLVYEFIRLCVYLKKFNQGIKIKPNRMDRLIDDSVEKIANLVYNIFNKKK